MEWTLEEIAAATGGTIVPADGDAAPVISSVTIDSRSAAPGSLFVAVRAERDGHEFVEAAAAAGSRAALVDERGAARLDRRVPLVVVDDTVAALGRLGAAARRRLGDVAVIGVTGSVGKTTTKDLLAGAVSSRPSVASARSWNNELGVPLTLLDAPEGTAVAVIEMGARGAGHIAALCRIASPTIAVVTTIGEAHLGTFGDLDGVAVAKAELVESLPTSGTAVLNADDDRVATMARRTPASVLTFGARGEIRAVRVEVADDLRVRFTIETPWGRAATRPATRGRHNVANALAAAGAALAAGVDLAEVVEGLERGRSSPWRMEVHRSVDGGVVLNDAYNANPTSVLAALDALSSLPARRRVAVLGLMAELGEGAGAAHAAVAEAAQRAGIELVAVGTPLYGPTPVTPEEAVERVGPVTEGVAVLVKASRVSGLEVVAQGLIGHAGHAADAG